MLLPLLAGCGFTPLYGDKGLVSGLSHVQVEVPQTRTGYLMREQLQDDLAVKRDDKPEYRLVIELNEVRLPRGLRPDATADRYETRVRVNYTLTRIATGEVVLQRNSTVSVVSDAAAQPYAGIASQQDAQERVAWEASQVVRTQILRALAAR
jgi:LPS-assembly lipoprotein